MRCEGTTMPRYAYDTIVTILSRTIVFYQSEHPSYASGPVALKVTVSTHPATPIRNVGPHPTRHEARMYAVVCPHPSIPDFVECEEDTVDTARFLPSTATTSADKDAANDKGVDLLPVLVTQFVKAASMDRLFLTFPTLQWSVVARVARHVVLVLQHVHKKGVVYGDLKLPNVLLGGDGHVWLVDFASAVIPSELRGSGGGGNNNSNNNNADDERSGVPWEVMAAGITPHMRAPELCAGHMQNSNEKEKDGEVALLRRPFLVDFWSFGAFLLELLTGRPALGSFEVCSGELTAAAFDVCLNDSFTLVCRRYGASRLGSVRALLLGLLQRTPEIRIGEWDDVLGYPFLAEPLAPFPVEYNDEIDELMLGF